MSRIRSTVLKTVAAILIGVPLLGLATCAYTSFSPHLRFDPVLVELMDAPLDEGRWWITQPVPLAPDYFKIGEQLKNVRSRLEASGFELLADYSTDVGPRDSDLGDSMSQARMDQEFLERKKYYNGKGITHIFERTGRASYLCGESFYVEAGFSADSLTQITGYTRKTCF